MSWRLISKSRLAQIADFLTACVVFTLAHVAWQILYSLKSRFFPVPMAMTSDRLLAVAAISVLVVFLFDRQQAYSYQRFTSLRTELLIVLKVSVMTLVLTVVAAFFVIHQNVPRTIFILYFAFSVSVFSVQKILLFHGAAWMRARGRDKRKIVIAGAGETAKRFIDTANKKFEWALDIVGVLSPAPANVGAEFAGVQVLGSFGDIEKVLKTFNPEDVVIAVSAGMLGQAAHIIEVCQREGVEVRLHSDFFGYLTQHIRTDTVYGITIISFGVVRQDGWRLLVKRAIDILGAAFGLLIFSPLMLVAAVGIWITDGRPILYRWNVVGLNKKPFKSWKFRTMRKDADELKSELLALNEMDGPVFKIRNDPRVIPFGKWLRKWSIDETPQLLSVLKGDLSLVGPRPAGPHELERYESWHRRKLSIKPGLTCLWQVNGRNGIHKFDDWVKLDLEYIDNWSLLLDLKILLKTIPAVISGKGAS